MKVAIGSALVIPTGWAFQFRAASDTPLTFLCYTSPPWPGDEEADVLSPPLRAEAGGEPSA
jgi:mannose-6-phosphate isomerase-like protein (cupin superfamily)